MPEESGRELAARFERAVPSETETLVSLDVTPGSVCTLSHPQVPGHSIQLDADDHGTVRFHVRPQSGASPVELELRVRRDDGRETVHGVALSGGAAPARPQDQPRAPDPARQVRPPLEGDLLALANHELVARGYPPRPDPERAPGHYARWLANVSREYAVVSRRVPHPGVSFARLERGPLRPDLPPVLQSPTLPLPPPIARTMFNGSFNNWSGAYLTRPTRQFDYVTAEWVVPGVFSRPGAPPYSAAAEWVGLDNSGTDLFQSGTDSECWTLPPLFGGWTITNYWMWIQSLPFSPWGVPFAVSPGDTVSVTMFLADENGMTWFRNGANGGLTAADNSVWFMLYNETQHSSFWGTLPTAPETIDGRRDSGFSGTTAEFIVERPSDANGNAVPLASFLITSMHDCWYSDGEYGNSFFALGADGSQPFLGNLSYVNMVDQANGHVLAVAFSVPDPDAGAENHKIIWVWVAYT